MKLIKNFETDSFSRLIWLNRDDKKSMFPMLSKISSLVSELEILSVVQGHRACSWQTISEDELISFTSRMTSLGLITLPLKRVAKFNGFSHRHRTPVSGQTNNLCVVVSKDINTAINFKQAFEIGDNIRQGGLLGYPLCCCEFFQKVWREGFYDPIWQMAERSEVIENGKNYLKVKAHPYSNPLLRYIGPRAGFHIPCSFSCQETIRVNSKRMELAYEVDNEIATMLDKLLRMPMRWDVLNGIAMIKTPMFYVVVHSVPVIENYIVEVVSA